MATISPVGVWVTKGVHQTTWSGLTSSGDTINPESAPNLPIKTVEMTSTALGSAVITMVGTNGTSTTTFHTLNTVTGGTAQFTATTDPLIQIGGNPYFIKPTVSGATGGTNANIIMVSR